MAFVDLCRFIPTLGGTTDWVYSSAVGGCQGPAAANVQAGLAYDVYAVSNDKTQWELSTGVNSGVTTFPRTTVLANSAGTGTLPGQSGAGTKISFSTVPEVSVVAIRERLLAIDEASSFTVAQKAQARANIDAASVSIIQPGGRLTTSIGVAKMTTSVAAATVLYYAPAVSPLVPIYDSTKIISYQFTSSDTDTTGLTLTLGSNWTAGTLYDCFIVLKSGVVTLVTGPAWSAATAGASTRGYSLAIIGGILTNAALMTVRDTNSTTFSVSANQATYVGTFLTNGSAGQIDFKFGTAAAGGGAALAGYWNCYNRTLGAFSVIDSNASWSPTATLTWQPLDGSTNNGMNFITGLGDDPIAAELFCTIAPPTGKSGKLGLGVNSTTSPASGSVVFAVGNTTGSGMASAKVYGAAGNNYIRALQYTDDLTTLYATGGPTQEALLLEWWF